MTTTLRDTAPVLDPATVDAIAARYDGTQSGLAARIWQHA
jgi:hypothetical protein